MTLYMAKNCSVDKSDEILDDVVPRACVVCTRTLSRVGRTRRCGMLNVSVRRVRCITDRCRCQARQKQKKQIKNSEFISFYLFFFSRYKYTDTLSARSMIFMGYLSLPLPPLRCKTRRIAGARVEPGLRLYHEPGD